MTEPTIDVLGIGNAIVDILVQTNDSFLTDNDLHKGAMTLVSFDEQMELYEKTGQAVESSGGSAANTLAGIAALGGKAAFAGKVKADQLGVVFSHDIRGAGVTYETERAKDGAPTATGPSSSPCRKATARSRTPSRPNFQRLADFWTSRFLSSS